MIKLYKKAVHGDNIQELLLKDSEGSSFMGEDGIYQTLNDADYFNYRLVKTDDDGKVIGFIMFGDASSISGHVYLNELYISKDYRKKGISKKFMEKGYEYYKRLGFKRIKLRVYAHNVDAIKVYQKAGFKKCGYHEGSEVINGKLATIFFYEKHINLDK